jgi:predicted ATPase/class 3 adenylate cyclase
VGELPSGTVTFLFSDIEGSTRLLHELGDGTYMDVLAQHRQVLRAAFAAHNGIEIGTEGDSFFVAFALASDAVAAAVKAQRGLEGGRVWVRMGLDAGEPLLTREGYVGMVVHRAARISAVAHGGQVLLSEAVAKLVEDRLPVDVGLRDLGHVRLKDLTKPEHVYQVLHPQLRESFPALRSLERTPNNLPQQLTSFVGREREQAEVRRLLQTARLVTLIGVGGLGKTRLSLQVAGEVIDEYAGGVWCVELAPLTEAALVAQAVALVLGVKEKPGRPLIESLIEYVKDRPLLLLLDNCEHLGPACAELVKRLLQAGEQLKVLATSRERLHVSGETTYPLAPLSVPGPQQTVTVEALTQYEAVRLFIARALAAQPTFQASPRNATAVADICRRLDGIPLALELAAARVGALSVEHIAVRLGDRFRLLTRGDQTKLPRQQTMRACIDWSYELLSEPERELLRRLTVFAGWTLDAAEAVGAGGEIEQSDVLDLLTHLVEKSLVQFDAEHARYWLLETVRQYAREKLHESGGADSVLERHRNYFLALAEQGAAAEATDANLKHWTPLWQLESDNMRAALKWSIDNPTEAQEALRFCGALRSFWWRSGRAREGGNWCEKALASPSDAKPSKPLLEALITLGMTQNVTGNQTKATNSFEKALELSREIGAATREALVLRHLATVKATLGQIETAESLYQQSIAINRAHGELSREAVSQTCLATLYINEGKFAAAEAPLDRAIALSQDLGDVELEAYNVSQRGLVAQYQGNYNEAKIHHEGALVIARNLGLKVLELEQLRHLGEIATESGQFESARVLLRESLVLSRDLDSWDAIRDCLDATVQLAASANCLETATKLAGAVDRLRDTMNAPRFAIDQERFRLSQAHCRTALGNEEYLSTIAVGKTWEPTDTLAGAMAWLEQALTISN